VVFLAGGTGIAPALQVAYTLLSRPTIDEQKPISISFGQIDGGRIAVEVEKPLSKHRIRRAEWFEILTCFSKYIRVD
jgi:hypothetical protein